MSAASTLTVLGLNSQGGSLRLDYGALDFEPSPESTASWRLEAGPFRLERLGTVHVEWRPGGETLLVSVRTGGTLLRGPTLIDGQTIGAGATYQVNLMNRDLTIAPGMPRDEFLDLPSESLRTDPR